MCIRDRPITINDYTPPNLSGFVLHDYDHKLC
jgi:hypothetical protein